MPRIALLVLALVVGLLIVVALQPDTRAPVPGSAIVLQETQVTLYPQADPDAIWHFTAPTVEYDPERQEATLLAIEDGRRTLAGETDFTLASERVVIDRDDNLRGEAMLAHLVEDEIDLDMRAKDGRLVLIDQREGRFEVPRATMSGPDLGESVFEDMRISFDFTDFQSGGAGTVGYAQFVVDSPNANEPDGTAPDGNPAEDAASDHSSSGDAASDPSSSGDASSGPASSDDADDDLPNREP